MGIFLDSNTVRINHSDHGPHKGEAQRLPEASLDLLLGHPIMISR